MFEVIKLIVNGDRRGPGKKRFTGENSLAKKGLSGWRLHGMGELFGDGIDEDDQASVLK